MRDKKRTKEYYDACIKYHSRDLESIENDIHTASSASWKLSCKERLFTTKINILVAKYSRGDSLLEIKKEFEKLVGDFGNFEEEVFRDLKYYSYVTVLRFASLEFLLNSNAQEKIRNKLKLVQFDDSLIECMLSDKGNVPDSEKLAEPGIVKDLVRGIETQSCIPLAEYLTKWYHNHKYDPWYNGHGIFDDWGKWSFAAAAVAKRFKLDDEALKNDPFYPYDLAHFDE